jgi:hypothetical protein
MYASIMQVAGYVPWTTAQVADSSKSPTSCCESVKKLPVQRLMLQFPRDSQDIFRSDPIVASLNLVELVVSHWTIISFHVGSPIQSHDSTANGQDGRTSDIDVKCFL